MQPILSLVLDRKALRRPLLEAVEAAVRAGVDWIQVRDRELDSRELLRHTCQVLRCARAAAEAVGRPVRVFVNRRIDVALAAGADGVQLGGDALGAREARALLGPQARIGVSTHSIAEVARAAEGPANYAQLAPVFAPLSKKADKAVLGIEAFQQACRVELPVLAQGGIEVSNCGEVIAAGAAGVTVTGAILLADDPGAATTKLRAALDGSASR